MNHITPHCRVVALAVLAFSLQISALRLAAALLGTAFTYQGRLNDGGAPANGSYDLQLTLFDALSGGWYASPVVSTNGLAVSNGLFTVALDFGNVFSTNACWLQIEVKTNGAATYATLVPRQPVTPAPYALYAPDAGTAGNVAAANVTGRLSDGQLSTNVALLNTSPAFAGTVSASAFAGRGALPWEEVTGASQIASPNVAYLANSPNQVAVSLPDSPVVGDITRVSGLGPGGWIINQWYGQSILTENIGGIGAVWTPRGSNGWWSCVASSADGSRLAAISDMNDGRIYTSADFGATWVARGPTWTWEAVAMSADGSKLVAVPYSGQIHTSADYGTTWTPRESTREWRCVASSADGTKLVAVPNDNLILTSTNSGVTWTTIETNANWHRVAMSADGNTLFAVGALGAGVVGPIYVSFDFGGSWYASAEWMDAASIACSADGRKVFAAGMYLYSSTNYGFGWTAHGENRSWRAIACSADGGRLLAADGAPEGDGLYTSADSGLTWTERLNGEYAWRSVASSADGTRLVAAGRQIHTSVPTTTPGAAGYLAGGQGSEVQLQYIGNHQFRVLSAEGTISVEGAAQPTGLSGLQAGLQGVQAGLDTKVSKAGDTMTGPLINNVVFAGNGAGLTNLNTANLIGLLQANQLAPGSVTTAAIAPGAVTTMALQDGAVTADKMLTQEEWRQLVTFTNPTPAVSDYFGSAVAAVGTDKVLIGAGGDDTGATDAGAAYLFSTNGTLLTTFTNPTPAVSDSFGSAVAAVGSDRVLIGAFGDNTGRVDAGAAYLFDLAGNLLTTFTNPTPAASDHFGVSVAAAGTNRVFIGAPDDDTGSNNAGAAYLFDLVGNLLTTFTNPTPAADDEFGYSLAAVGNDRVIIGAYGDDTGAVDAGAAYLFTTNGTLLTTFTNPTAAMSGTFGCSVAAVGSDRVLIGAKGGNTGANNGGAAYLFSTAGALLTTFTNPTPATGDSFAHSVAAVGSDRVLIGAPTDDTGSNNAGAAYLFDLAGNLLTTFTNPTPAVSDSFGSAVAAVGSDQVLVGARYDHAGSNNGGAAYLFSLESFTPGLVAQAVRHGAITTDSLEDGAVTAVKIATGAVTLAKLDSAIGVWTKSGSDISYVGGNVGIGTATPAAKLEVQGGSIKATGGLIIEVRTNDPPSPVTGQIWLVIP